MALLRNRRLDAVRARLLEQPGHCVTDTALEFGFGHLGRFSSYYRERFGELPSQTAGA
ncbi:transcriptional regulator EutR [compost metagenome]